MFTDMFTIRDGVGLHVLARRLRNLTCASMEKWTWCFPLISPVIFFIHDSKSWIVPVALRKRFVSGCPANRLTQNCLGKPDRYASNCRHMSVQAAYATTTHIVVGTSLNKSSFQFKALLLLFINRLKPTPACEASTYFVAILLRWCLKSVFTCFSVDK